MKLFEPIRIIARSGDPYRNPIVVVLTRKTDFRFNRIVGDTMPVVLVDGASMAALITISSPIHIWCSLCVIPIVSLLAISIPIIFAVYATNLTTRLMTSGDYQLVKLTAINPIERIWGVMFATMHHLRLLVALSIARLPVYLLVTIAMVLFTMVPLSSLITVVLIEIGLVGMPVIGLIAGFYAGLKYEESVQAISVAAGFTLSVMVLIILGIIGLAAFRLQWLAAMLSTIPFFLIIGAFHLAEQWA